ncbi:Endoribonuclease L-PSP [Phlebopus sp. FC_14]|nr:Endoribonuclease L-PSP [Phlebopus sp. FC_14]
MPIIVKSPEALPTLPVFSQAAIGSGKLVFVSGNIGCDSTFTVLPGGVGAQTAAALDNIEKVLKAAGSSLQKIVKANVYMRNMERDFKSMNEVYARYFPEGAMPARTCIGVAYLPFEADVEIECVAEVPE